MWSWFLLAIASATAGFVLLLFEATPEHAIALLGAAVVGFVLFALVEPTRA